MLFRRRHRGEGVDIQPDRRQLVISEVRELRPGHEPALERPSLGCDTRADGLEESFPVPLAGHAAGGQIRCGQDEVRVEVDGVTAIEVATFGTALCEIEKIEQENSTYGARCKIILAAP